MPLSDEAVRRYDRLLGSYRLRTAAVLAAAWDRLSSYDDEGIEEFVALTAPALAGAKRSAVASSTAIFALALGIRTPAITPDDVDTEPRIRHPFLAMWHVAMDFVQQTARRTGDTVARTAGVRTRWRRVPNSGACQWCQTISGQLYRTAESADFGHDRCFCMVVPEDDSEVGQVVTRTYERGTGRTATGQRSHRTLTESERQERSRPNERWSR
jgi:hypothetical protein